MSKKPAALIVTELPACTSRH